MILIDLCVLGKEGNSITRWDFFVTLERQISFDFSSVSVFLCAVDVPEKSLAVLRSWAQNKPEG